MNVSEMVARARRGDADAFTRLVTDRKDSLYRIAYSHCHNREDALDIVSETVYRAFVSLSKLKNADHFYTWLIRILINCAVNHTRKMRRLVLTDRAAGDLASSEVGTEELLDLHRAIEKLDQKQKSVIILKYLNDMTVEDVAEVMQMPVGTVKTHLHKALKELRLELKED